METGSDVHARETLSEVDRAIDDGRALFVFVTDDSLPDEEHADASRRMDEIREAGGAVVTLPWSRSDPDSTYTALDSVVERSIDRALVTVVDIHLRSAVYAYFLAELAWHSGCTVVLRIGDAWNVHRDAVDTDVLAGVAHADVVVASDDVVAALLAAPADMNARVARDVGARQLLDIAGPLEPPAPGLSMTVLIATYDRPEELAACLRSLTEQTLPSDRFDVVVVDDASPVDVTPIVDSFAEQLRITLLRLPVNSGPAAARAAGVTAAAGEVVMLLDDDDVATPRVLAEHLRVHSMHPHEHVAVLGHTAVMPLGRPTALSRHVTRVGRQYFNYGSFTAGQTLGWPAFWAGRISAKRTLLVRHSFRGSFMEDTDFAWRADLSLSERGTPLEVHYARSAVQVMRSRLDLHGMRQRQVKMGWAARDFENAAGLRIDEHNDHERLLWALVKRSRVESQALDELPLRAQQALGNCRLKKSPAASASTLARLDGLLNMDLAAHQGSGFLAKSRLDSLLFAGRVPVLAVDGREDDAVSAAAATRRGDALHLLIVVPSGDSWSTRFVTRLEARLHDDRRTLDDVGDVELCISDDPWKDTSKADFVLDPQGRRHYNGEGAVPLLSLSASEWVARITRPATIAGSLH